MKYCQCYHCKEWGRHTIVDEMKIKGWPCHVMRCFCCGKQFVRVKDKNDE